MSSAEDNEKRSNPFELLTVMEAADELRVGRTRIYEMATEYLESGGRAGLPVIAFGPRSRRVPRWALDELKATGHVVNLNEVRFDRRGLREAG
jgi:hypothetical protein